MQTTTSADRGQEFLDSHIITDEVLKNFVEQDEVKKIRPATDYREQVKKSFLGFEEEKGDKLPFLKCGDMRFRKGEITIWSGYNGHKKSMFLGQVCIGFSAQGKRVCIASPEMQPKKTLKRMCRQFAGVSEPTGMVQDQFFNFIKDTWLYDQSGTLQARKLLSIIRYTKQELNIDHFVIDSLMKCGISEDDLNKQKWFVDELATVAKDLDIHIHLVAHQRKPMDTEAKPGSKYGTAGSANITNLADNVIVIFENQKEERTYDHLVLVEKQRNYDGDNEAQPSFIFHFSNKSLQFKESKNSPDLNPSDWSQPIWL